MRQVLDWKKYNALDFELKNLWRVKFWRKNSFWKSWFWKRTLHTKNYVWILFTLLIAQILSFMCNFKKHDFEEKIFSEKNDFEYKTFSKKHDFEWKKIVKSINLK